MSHVVPKAPKKRRRCKYCNELKGSAWTYDPYLVHIANNYTYMFICGDCFKKSEKDCLAPKPKLYTIWQMVGSPRDMLDDCGYPKTTTEGVV